MLVITKVIQATPPTDTNKVENLYQSNNLLSELAIYYLPINTPSPTMATPPMGPPPQKSPLQHRQQQQQQDRWWKAI